MSRRQALFTQSDLSRAIKAAKQAGVEMAVEISPDGTIRLIPAQQIQGPAASLRPGLVL